MAPGEKTSRCMQRAKVCTNLAERCRDLTKQIDLAAKLAGRAVDIAVRELDARESNHWANTDINTARRVLEDARSAGVEALRRARYFVLQADWLQERFPDAELRNVEGLVKFVSRAEIEEHDWSLTPGRYVGVAPEVEDEGFDFEEALRSIHIDLLGLNEEASQLAARITQNFEGVANVTQSVALRSRTSQSEYTTASCNAEAVERGADFLRDQERHRRRATRLWGSPTRIGGRIPQVD